MTAKILRTEAAQQDLDHHATYIQRERPAAAVRFLDAANEAFQLLAEMPHMGGLCGFENPKVADVRMWTIPGFKNYVVFFRPIEDGIEVVRVLHAARDIAAIFEAE